MFERLSSYLTLCLHSYFGCWCLFSHAHFVWMSSCHCNEAASAHFRCSVFVRVHSQPLKRKKKKKKKGPAQNPRKINCRQVGNDDVVYIY